MIDSGATGNFCDIKYARKMGIRFIKKSTLEVVRAVDGTNLSSGPISHETEPIQMQGFGGHQEQIIFNLIDAPQFQLILGLPCLTEHNPQTDWSKRTIKMNSSYCKENCFHDGVEVSTKSQAACLSSHSSMICALKTAEIPKEYEDLVAVFDEKEAEKLPPHRPYDCKIELEPGAILPCSRIYALTEAENQHLKDYLDQYLANGFIRPSESPVSSPLFFIPKKDGSLRTCIDYRALNQVTIKNRYPLPLVSVLLDQVKNARIYTKLDLRGAYHLIRVASGDEWKTAFRTRYGLFEYQVMLYGLCNAPAAFQHFVNDILREFLDRIAVVYIDDILIFSDNLQEHISHVRSILTRLQENHLYVKLEKCAFHVERVEFLGFILSPEGVSMDPAKIKTVQHWPSPCNVKEIQSFLGFANFYRRFISNFSQTVTPITRLLKKGVKFEWTKEAENAFNFLKNSFVSAPILLHPNPDEPYYVEADASDVAIGGILSQRHKDTGQLHPVAYFSRKLTPPEINYSIADKELLAVKETFCEWRHYILGAKHKVTVYMDHRNLQFLKSARTLTARQLRWSLYFADFDFVITFRPGKVNGKADALSRIDTGAVKEPPEKELIIPQEKFISAILYENLTKEIQENLTFEGMLKWSKEGQGREIKKGLPYFKGALYVPTVELQEKILQAYHDDQLAGHKGIQKTQNLIQREFWCSKMKTQIRQYVSTCDKCQRGKSNRTASQGLLRPLPTAPHAWHTVTMDLIVDLPSSQGFNTILVFVDTFTKMAHFIPLKEIPRAPQVAQLFTQHIVRAYGIPKILVSDRGSQFVSRFWKAFSKRLGIDSRYSTSYHPETDGQTESVNQELEQYLRLNLFDKEKEWPELMWAAEFAYNNAVHSTTGFTPFYLNHGRHPNVMLGKEDDSVPAVEEMVRDLQTTLVRARENIIQAKDS
ncbi:hypothetical protein NDU88_004194 [Pleurodeles waltl]|uniref:Gypsy retrotransposon integrase-like protein 1 n=1 Tax=Pleurodeles waltl TaxID=8319 RepID=A0AAV7V2W4_PLEWA|nr:hypothetical protein NDU88_004194 [Pleurodeles waltl]